MYEVTTIFVGKFWSLCAAVTPSSCCVLSKQHSHVLTVKDLALNIFTNLNIVHSISLNVKNRLHIFFNCPEASIFAQLIL